MTYKNNVKVPVAKFNYRPQTKFGARECFYTCVSFCSRGWGGGGGVGLPVCITGHMTSIQGVCIWGGLHLGGVCLQPPRTRKAGGTHPNGMLSCFMLNFDAEWPFIIYGGKNVHLPVNTEVIQPSEVSLGKCLLLYHMLAAIILIHYPRCRHLWLYSTKKGML